MYLVWELNDIVETLSQNNVEIEANDSLFIFIKVTVDPTNQNAPLVGSTVTLMKMNKLSFSLKLLLILPIRMLRW